MTKIRNAGFTMIELMVVIVLIGMIATMAMPRLFRRPPSLDWSAIADGINNLVFFARQEAISNQKIYRLTFQSSNKKEPQYVVVEEEAVDPEDAKKLIYKQVYSPYFNTRHDLAEPVKMVSFYQGKNEFFAENKGRGYCYVIPDGLVQDVVIHLIRLYEGQESKASLKMMPFTGKFELFDGHIKPEK